MYQDNTHILSEYIGKYPVLFAYIFGSQVIGKVTALSDLDIAIFISRAIPKPERFDIRLRLSNELSSSLKKQVDVVILNDAPLQLAYEIIKYGKTIVCKDREAQVEIEGTILSKYLDRRYYDKRRAETVLNGMRTTSHL